MMGHNIPFKGVIQKINPKLSFLPLLIWNTDLITIFMMGWIVLSYGEIENIQHDHCE